MNLAKPNYEMLKQEIDDMLSVHSHSGESPSVITATEASKMVFSSWKDSSPSTKLPSWIEFNECTGGFRGREFTILCGSTGSGKTEFLANISSQLMHTKTPHVVWSVETGPVDFARRVYSTLMGKDLNRGEGLSAELLKQVDEQHGDFFRSSSLSLFRYENRIPSKILLCDLLYARKYLGAEIAMIDNLNFFLEVTTSAEQIVEMDRVIHNIIIFCKQIDMHVIMVMHPKKTDHGRVESEFDIKGSSTAVQEAHNVILFNRPSEEMLRMNSNLTKNCRELTFAKLRRRGNYAGRKIWFEREECAYQEIGIQS